MLAKKPISICFPLLLQHQCQGLLYLVQIITFLFFLCPPPAVHVPPAAVTLPAGVQQQPRRVVLLQAPLRQAGPHAVPDHDPAHPLLIFLLWTTRGQPHTLHATVVVALQVSGLFLFWSLLMVFWCLSESVTARAPGQQQHPARSNPADGHLLPAGYLPRRGETSPSTFPSKSFIQNY